MSRKVAGVTSDGVKILEPVSGGKRTITRADAREMARGMRMGGAWTNPTGSKLVRSMSWSLSLSAVSYGAADWPSRSYRLFAFEAE